MKISDRIRSSNPRIFYSWRSRSRNFSPVLPARSHRFYSTLAIYSRYNEIIPYRFPSSRFPPSSLETRRRKKKTFSLLYFTVKYKPNYRTSRDFSLHFYHPVERILIPFHLFPKLTLSSCIESGAVDHGQRNFTDHTFRRRILFFSFSPWPVVTSSTPCGIARRVRVVGESEMQIHPVPEVIGQGSHEHAFSIHAAVKVIQPERISFVSNAE